MGLVFVPFYIKLMGVESYAIVGVYVSLTGMLAVLDFGLPQSMNREMARLSADQNSAERMADTARTLEIVYWGIALLVTIIVILLSHFIAYHWLNPENLSRESLLQALWIMALTIGLRWPLSIYTGGLNGLQRQVLVNINLAVFATLQGLGALAILYLIAPTVQVFFVWQALVALLQVVVMRIALWRHIPPGGRFRRGVLCEIWRFAAGVSGISLLSMVLTQMDKVLLSKFLSLSDFGYYAFAAAVAAVIYRIIAPVFTAYYPRFTELVANQDYSTLVKTYHQGCQLMVVAVLPLAFVLIFFSREILELWVRDPLIVSNSYLLVSLLVVGNLLNGLMNLPYAMQLAHGWIKLALYSDFVAVILLAPAIYYSVSRWGALGAAAVWVILNSCYILIGLQIMHRRVLCGELARWFLVDIGIPVLVTCLVMIFFLNVQPFFDAEMVGRILFIVGVVLSGYLMVVLAVPIGRAWLRQKIFYDN